ncbi:unnamed protein product [Clavelina lepadiformis]|uniref:Rho-GAP domain-containing protein n=1 Tax=Clavelina lepadiformis TaxID=159417 RepID=A0ABP0FGX5_CLALP
MTYDLIMTSPTKSSPVKPHFYDPDHYVIKMKYEKWDEFTELIFSHLTRLLDLPGAQLEVLRGHDENALKDKSNKLSQSGKKSWNPLKKKDLKSKPVLSEESLSQIEQLTDFLGRNLSIEGIFRKPGNSIRQNQLMTALGTGACINFEKSQFQPHDVASVLKTLLGQLTEPLLLPSKHFDAHVQISNMNCTDSKSGNITANKAKRIETLQLLLLLLPTAYRKVLRGIFGLLYQTAKHQNENKMNAANLSAMVTPHLIWPRTAKASDIHNSIAGLNDHVAFMIRHSQKIFLAPSYIRDAASAYYKETINQQMMSPQVSTTQLVAPSSAVKRTASERLRYGEKTRANTEEAISELFDQVSNMPNSSKKKKMVKNFSKHQQVLKYQNKPRKRNKTFSGILRKKTSQGATSSNDSYQRFPQPGDDALPDRIKYGKLPKPDLLNDCNADTVSLGANIKHSTGNNKSISHVSLPDRITRSCKVDVKSPRLMAFSKQIRLLQQRKSASPSVKLHTELKETKSTDSDTSVKSVKVSTV